MKLYLRTTMDELELPVAVGYTPKELAEMLHTTENNVRSSIAHKRRGWYKVVIEKEEEE